MKSKQLKGMIKEGALTLSTKLQHIQSQRVQETISPSQQISRKIYGESDQVINSQLVENYANNP